MINSNNLRPFCINLITVLFYLDYQILGHTPEAVSYTHLARIILRRLYGEELKR